MPLLSHFLADGGELLKTSMEREPCSMDNKHEMEIMRNRQQLSSSITQSPLCVTSQFIFSELVGSSTHMKSSRVRGIADGFTAKI